MKLVTLEIRRSLDLFHKVYLPGDSITVPSDIAKLLLKHGIATHPIPVISTSLHAGR